MSDNEQYLNMQRTEYEREAARWSLAARDHVVGSYDAHNAWSDYDTLLFKNFDTTGLIALEYGCGPGRNLIRYAPRFERIDGIDIANNNLVGAKVNLEHNNLPVPNLYHNDGSSMPMIADDTYDVVFSVICLQHIGCYDVRFSIFKEIHRVLKPGGRLCFQMGYGGKAPGIAISDYYSDGSDAKYTNGGQDVVILTEDVLRDDLLTKIGFKTYESNIGAVGPGDNHKNWIWVQVEK